MLTLCCEGVFICPYSEKMKVLWRSGVILYLCSQNSQVDRVRYQVEPHHLSVMTRGHGLDYTLATSVIPALGPKNRNVTFTFRTVVFQVFQTEM